MRDLQHESGVPVTGGAAPEHVTILGLGQSLLAFVDMTRRLGGRSGYCDAVWGINGVGDVLACDLIFHMDDMRVQEARVAANPKSNIAVMVEWLKTTKVPVITSVPRYPNHFAFPLEEVLNRGQDHDGCPYFNSTAAYAVAYAIHIGVKRISLYGIDYTLQNFHTAERGRACVEFWLGIASANGIEISLPQYTSLMDACAPAEERLYGYDCVDVALSEGADRLIVTMTEKAAPVDAAEIERRYDHTKHPNPMMRAE